MSSCSTILNSGYTGFDSITQVYDLDFTGLANGSSIDITVGSVERPDYFTVRIDGTPVENSGWIGFATYPGPWGATLSGPTSYFFSTITYDNTKSYSVDILIGPADPGAPTTDAYDIEVDCSSPPPTPTPTNTPISSECASSTYDVVILLDQSGSIDDIEYALMSAATVDLVSKLSSYLSTGATGFQFGVVAFSSTSSQRQVLTDNQSLINAALGNRVFAGGTNIASGLQQSYFTSIGTNTRNVNKKIILYTDGNPNPGTQAATVLTANTINNSVYNSIYKTEILCVGIGSDVTYSNLYQYAADPSLVYSASTFNQIQSINAQIVNGICQPLLTPTPTPTPTVTIGLTPTATPTPMETPTQTPTNNPNTSECYILNSAPFGGCTFVYKNEFDSTITLNIPTEDTGLCFTACVSEVVSDDCGFFAQGFDCNDPGCSCSPPTSPDATPTQTTTPTPTETPTQTVTPSTTPPPDGCVCYQYTNDGDSGGINSITYLDCNHVSQSINNVPFPGGTGYFCGILGSVTASAGLTVGEVSESFCPGGGCFEGPTSTPTPTNTSTPTETPTQTQTQTQTQTETPTQTQTSTQTPTTTTTLTATPTQTPTETPTQTPTETPTETPTNTPTQTQTPTQTETPTPTQTQTPTTTLTATPTQTPTETPTQTQTETPTQTPTQTETPTQTPTETPTQTATNTSTPTETPTQTSTQTPTNTSTSTQTPTPTQTPGYTVQFQDCTNSLNIFRFFDIPMTLTPGLVYYISGGTEFTGCATVVTTTGAGPLYDGTGYSFQQTASGCADALCPTVSNVAALLYKCSNGSVFYGNVKEDTAFVGAAYLYNGECYSFVEFSGLGGPDLGDPDFDDCSFCVPTPTPTSTPQPTPTQTPTVSASPSACAFTDFCFYTTLPSFSGYNGNYESAGTYNSRIYYSGDGITSAVIYHTGSFWCLSDTLGGTCLLRGSNPCNSQCPDISANDFEGGICPTPTPTGVDCSIFNFNAYFDCDWEPLPTPTPSVACDDVNFIIDSIGVTPTPTPSGNFCSGVGINFSLSGFTSTTPTVTLTPSVTLTRTVSIEGSVTFELMDETFSCVSAKVLTDCGSGEEFYTTDTLSFLGTPVLIGMTMFVQVNGVNRCVIYSRDDQNLSSNSTLGSIVQIYSSCEYCSTIPTPTPTTTSTPTNTPTSTAGITPSVTKTQTPTPSQTATLGTTPPPTPTQTRTPTATNTPTPSITASPSATPNFLYVYQSCNRIGGGRGTITQVIQTQPVSFPISVNETFKDNDANCWYFVGQFNTSYIAPPRVTPINFGGNYFTGVPSQTYSDCETCATGNIGAFGNSGVSDISIFDACSDAIINPKTLYSNCQTINSGCILYTDSTLQNVVSEIYVFHQGANWDLNGSGVVIGLSSTQC